MKLDDREQELLDKVSFLRRKIVAHSDEEEMHFRSSTFTVLDGEFNFPHMQFDEGLSFGETELRELETMLRKIMFGMAKFFFELAQNEPDVLQEYKIPSSNENPNNA